MSNKDRAGKSIAFYSDQNTLQKLNQVAKLENRSISNMLTVMINRFVDAYYHDHPSAERESK